jgi:hypothetical protein
VLAALLGTSVGTRLLERMSDASFRSITRRVVLALGVAYLAQGAWISIRPASTPESSLRPDHAATPHR